MTVTDLRRADLAGTDLARTDLDRTTHRRTDVACADLAGTTLRSAVDDEGVDGGVDGELDEAAHRLVRVSAQEAQGLLADGMVKHLVADVHTDLDCPDSAALRARAVRLALSPVLLRRSANDATSLEPVIGHRTAAWVHGGGPAPHRIDLVSPPGRARWRDPMLVTHEHRLGTADVTAVAGVTVTSPARTAADLARTLSGGQVIPLLVRLHTTCGLRPTAVLTQLDGMAHGRGVRQARDLVQRWAAALAETAVSVPA